MVTLGLLCFEYASVAGVWLLVPFLILFGIGYGGNITMWGVLPGAYFGRSKFGTILGFMMGIMMLGSITGPPLAGWVFDNWGSYQGVWFAFAGITIMGTIIVTTTPPVSATTKTIDKA